MLANMEQLRRRASMAVHIVTLHGYGRSPFKPSDCVTSTAFTVTIDETFCE